MNSSARELDLGARLRALRLRGGLSQRELARRAHVSNATISMIEADRVSPSVSALRQILAPLGVGIGDFFSAPEPPGEQVVFRADELTEISGGAVSYRQVGANLRDRALQMIYERYRPGAQSGAKMLSHQGEEAGLVIKGRLTLEEFSERVSGALAARTRVPAPSLLVLVGVVVALIPGVPAVASRRWWGTYASPRSWHGRFAVSRGSCTSPRSQAFATRSRDRPHI